MTNIFPSHPHSPLTEIYDPERQFDTNIWGEGGRQPGRRPARRFDKSIVTFPTLKYPQVTIHSQF